jgi:hypothetical protein
MYALLPKHSFDRSSAASPVRTREVWRFSMSTYRITYRPAGGVYSESSPPPGARTEDVEADRYQDNGEWIDFFDEYDGQLLRVTASKVKRVERISASEPRVPGVA